MAGTAGLVRATAATLAVQEGGVLWSGMPCSSFVWIARASHQRSDENIWGDTEKPKIELANTLLLRWLLLAFVAVARKVLVIVEQPGSSLLDMVPHLIFLRALCGLSWNKVHLQLAGTLLKHRNNYCKVQFAPL